MGYIADGMIVADGIGLFIFTVTSIIMVSATLCRTCGPSNGGWDTGRREMLLLPVGINLAAMIEYTLKVIYIAKPRVISYETDTLEIYNHVSTLIIMPIVALDFFYNMAAPYKWSMTLLVAFTHALGLMSTVMPLEVCALNSGASCAEKHFIAYITFGWMTHMASTAATVLIVRRQYWRLKACIRDASTFTLIGAAGIYTIAPFCYPILWSISHQLSSKTTSEFVHIMHMIVDVFAFGFYSVLQMGFRGQFDQEAWIDWQKAGGGDLDVGGGRVSMYEMTSTVVEDTRMSRGGGSGSRRQNGQLEARQAPVRDGRAAGAGGGSLTPGRSGRAVMTGNSDHRGGSAAGSLGMPRAAASSINFVDDYGYIGAVSGAEMKTPRGGGRQLPMGDGAAAANDENDDDRHHRHHRRAEDAKRVQQESLVLVPGIERLRGVSPVLVPGIERLRGVSPPPLRDGGHSPPLAWSSGGGAWVSGGRSSPERYGKFGRLGSTSGRGRGLDRWVENQLSLSNDSPKEITSRKVSTRSPTSKVWTSLGSIRPRWHSDQQDSATSTENDSRDDTATSNGGRAGGILFSPRRNDSQASLESVKGGNMLERWPSKQGAASLLRAGSESSASGPGGGVCVGVGDVGGELNRTFSGNVWSPSCTPRKLSAPPAAEVDSEARRCKACKVVLPGSHSPNLEVCRECLSTGLFSMGGADDASGGGGKRRLPWMGEGSIERKNSKEGQPIMIKGLEPAMDHAPSPPGGSGIRSCSDCS